MKKQNLGKWKLMNFRLMPQNNGESDLIWLFLTLETPTREKLMQG
jgi:hypothetical protein